MENKLQQLTRTLYDEGLEKGRAEAERLVAEARAKADKIVADADAQAAEILRRAQAKAEDVEKNTLTEIALAGKQAVARIKSEIASLIVAKAAGAGVKEAAVDPAFIKEMLLAVAKNWNGADAGKVELQALLPEGEREKLDAAFEQSAKELLAAGIEVGYSKEVRTGFKVGAKEGGYYISFSDADMEALDAVKGDISAEDYMRAKFVIGEKQRVLDVCDALGRGDLVTVGRCMYETHEGLSKDYEVSCEELDYLNDIAKECGVTGSRIMGGGFGGCTINLVADDKYDHFIATAKEKFAAKYGHEPKIYDVIISDGARRL